MLCVCISSHGLGHLSQISTVLHQLHLVAPQLPIVVRSSFPSKTMAAWLPDVSQHVYAEDDVGMCMHDAIHIDRAASYEAYQLLHQDWERKVHQLGETFKADGVSLVLSDVPYLPLAAAQYIGIPNIALCSLNWADVIEHTFPSQLSWISMVREVYQNADIFLVPEPGMEMPWLNNQKRIAPLGRHGIEQRERLLELLGLAENAVIVLVGMGGMDYPLDISHWPDALHGKPLHYIVPKAISNQNAHASFADDLPFQYANLIASSDVLMTKPGYGMFVEAANAGTPVLYVKREGWPDVPSLKKFIHRVSRARELAPELLKTGSFSNLLEELLEAEGQSPASIGDGAPEAVNVIKKYF